MDYKNSSPFRHIGLRLTSVTTLTIRSIFPSRLLRFAALVCGCIFQIQAQTAGSLDTTFGNGTGIVTKRIYTILNSVANAESVAIQADGKIVVAGQVTLGQTSSFGVARYNTDCRRL